MMPAAKHGDPQMGVDIHLCVVPPSPSPVPLPTPHMSIIFDPFDYVPKIGATVTVCGMKRAVAGTAGKAVHIPPGFPFAPKIPDTADEVFMGSATVVADGNPFSFLAVPVLSCQVSGMPSPPRPKQQEKKLMLLPTTVNVAIPTNVFVGGPPTISLMGLAFKFGFAALGKFVKSGLFKRMRQKLFGRMKPGFLKCVILRAEPVDITSGEVSVEHEDFTLPGCIPLRWERSYMSNNGRLGACGWGWETPADIRLEIFPEDRSGVFLRPGGPAALFPSCPEAEGHAAAVLELWDGALLSDHGSEFQVRTKEDRIYHFDKAQAFTTDEGVLEHPVSRISDLCGNWLAFERDGRRLSRIHDRDGRRIDITSEGGLIHRIAMDLPGGKSDHILVDYSYDGPDLIAVRDALGVPYRFAYDQHYMVRHTNRNGLSFYYDYEWSLGARRVVHSWGDGGLYDYHFRYFTEAHEVQVTDSLGHVSIVTLDERRLPIREVDPLGGITTYEYDHVGRTVAVVDQDGFRWGYEYDDGGNPLRLTQPDGGSVSAEFDARGKAIRATDGNGGVWTQSYDQRGLLVTRSTPMGRERRYEYDGRGRLVAFGSRAAHHHTLRYTADGKLDRIIDQKGGVTQLSYDQLGNLASRTDPLGRVTSYFHDANGQLRRVVLPSGATNAFDYDGEGNLRSHTGPGGAATCFEYGGIGTLRRRVQADGHVVEYHYDTEERLICARNQIGQSWRFIRDPMGRIVREVDYWGQSTCYSYTGAGHIVARIDPEGRRVTYQTDPLGRVVKRTAPVPSGPAGVEEDTYVYDKNGNLVAFENAAARVERAFDLDGRMTEEREGDNVVICAFDDDGNLASRSVAVYSGGRKIGTEALYLHDVAGRLEQINVPGHATLHRKYDAAGQLTEDYLANGLRRTFSYTADGALCRQSRHLFSGGLLGEENYSYDRSLELAESRDSVLGSNHYLYDVMGILTQHVDAAGNSTRYQNTGTGDRLAREDAATRDAGRGEEEFRAGYYGDITYRFDRTGNVIERLQASDRTRLSWDGKQQLVRTCRNGLVTTYAYDAIGRRVSKTTNGVVTRFIWSGDVLAGEATLDHTAMAEPREVRVWIAEPDSFSPAALTIKRFPGSSEREQSAELYLTHREPNGCPNRLLTELGDVVWAARVGAWGAADTVVDELDNPIRLQGQYEDRETGLHYNRYRYYDPAIGQFLSPDPFGVWAGDNPYLFAPNVWTWIDPLGLAKKAYGKDTVFRALSAADREALDKGQALLPKGAGGSIADHVAGKPTGHISASLTEEAARRFDSGNGIVAINIGEATRGSTNFIDHNNVLQAARRSGDLTVARDAKRAEEVLFKGPEGIPASAAKLI
jgi:RHS repeat-associated protein